MPCSSSTSTAMAVELWAAGAVASWLKFTSQWTDISAFMQSKAQLLRACTLADSKFLADFVCRHDKLIPLLPESELFTHQSSTSTVVARMRNPRFICSLDMLRRDFRLRNDGTKKTDWFMHEVVDRWNIAILGDRWDTDLMPLFQFDRGGTIWRPWENWNGASGWLRIDDDAKSSVEEEVRQRAFHRGPVMGLARSTPWTAGPRRCRG